MQESKSKLFKQRLFRTHISVGIVFSLLMYISIFFGMFAILLPYIQTWEKPSMHFEKIENQKINYSSMLDEVLKMEDFPKDNILISLADSKGNPSIKISHMFTEPLHFNPYTGEKIISEGKQSHLAEFLNEMHYAKPLELIGRLLFGFMAVAVMFIVISGVMLITIMKFNNKGKNLQSVFSKYHIKIFTWVFPPFLLIVLTGAVMNIGLLGSGPMSQIITKGEAKNIDEVVGTVLSTKPNILKKENITVEMLDINMLIDKAKKINPNLNYQDMKLNNWNDQNAQIELIGYNPYMPFLNGLFNRPSVTLSAYNADFISEKKVMDRAWSLYFAEASFFLHFLTSVDIISRLFVVLIMLSSCLAIGFGVMLWLEKKAKSFDKKISFYHWMSKLSLATMIGIIPATATLFILQWTIPFNFQDRVLLQQGIFYNVWLATFFWSFYRINSYHAAKEFFYLGGILFIVAPIIHFISSGFSPIYLIEKGMENIFFVDLGLFILGILLILISKKLPLNRENSKQAFIKKEK